MTKLTDNEAEENLEGILVVLKSNNYVMKQDEDTTCRQYKPNKQRPHHVSSTPPVALLHIFLT